jgi:hypothetical protein
VDERTEDLFESCTEGLVCDKISTCVAQEIVSKAYRSASTFSRAPILRFPMLTVMWNNSSGGIEAKKSFNRGHSLSWHFFTDEVRASARLAALFASRANLILNIENSHQLPNVLRQEISYIPSSSEWISHAVCCFQVAINKYLKLKRHVLNQAGVCDCFDG